MATQRNRSIGRSTRGYYMHASNPLPRSARHNCSLEFIDEMYAEHYLTEYRLTCKLSKDKKMRILEKDDIDILEL